MVTGPLTPTSHSSCGPTAFGSTSPNVSCQIVACAAIFPPVHRNKRTLCVVPDLKDCVQLQKVSVDARQVHGARAVLLPWHHFCAGSWL